MPTPPDVDLALVDEHIARATRAAVSAYEAFDAYWKAFNVLYEAEAGAGNVNTEQGLMKRAVARVAGAASEVLEADAVAALVALDPIFDEKIWRRTGTRDKTAHNTARNRLRALRTRAAVEEDLAATVQVLYVIRCNLMHGFKTPEAPRDQEVLAAALPTIGRLVQALRAARKPRD